MGRRRIAGAVALLALSVFLASTCAFAQARNIDTAHSVMTVHVFKTGLFSGFAHNHEISAPISEGTVDIGQPRVSLRVDARKLRVMDSEVSDSTRAQIQKTMEGPEVLDSEQFPEISFQSESIEAAGNQHWIVDGKLTLHGETKPVRVEVSQTGGHYKGSATVKQRDFGIKPVSIAGGTVKVKNEVKIDFDLVLEK